MPKSKIALEPEKTGCSLNLIMDKSLYEVRKNKFQIILRML